MRAWLSTLRSDQRGAAVIEMAFATPILATMVIGMTELSSAYSMKMQLEQAAQRTIEKAQQTVEPTDPAFILTLQNEATLAAGTGSIAAVDFWLECDNVRAPAAQTACPEGTGITARYVTVDITKTYTPMFTSVRFAGSNANGSYTLHGKTGLRLQ